MTTHLSPDTKYTLTFTYVNEIRFGPPFYSVAVNDLVISERLFFEYSLWHPSSSLVVLKEFTNTSHPSSSVSALILINVLEMKFADVPQLKETGISNVRFEDESILYSKRCLWRIKEQKIKYVPLFTFNWLS